jgi:RNA polymerase sigma-70 factor (ECF subfamily)
MSLMIEQRPRQTDGEDRVENIHSELGFAGKGTGWRLGSNYGQNADGTTEPGFPVDQVVSEMSFADASGPLFGDLVSLSRRVLGDEDLAFDAVQEALVSLWLGGNLPDNLRGWLKGAVVRRSLHLARCRSRRRRREGRAAEQRREPSDRDDPRRSVEAQESVEIIMAAVLAIAPEFREVLVLSLDEEMDYATMAQRLGIPIGTVRSRLNRSRRALRTVLMRTLPEEYQPSSPV